MAKIRRVDFYPDDFVSGVIGLTAEQVGVYWLVCSLIASSRETIERHDKRIFRILDTGKAAINRAIDALIEAGKLVEFDGKLGQKRMENEVKSAQNRIKIFQENGQKGGRPSSKINDIEEPPGFSPTITTPITVSDKSSASVSFTSRDVSDALAGERDAAPRCPDPWVGLLEAFALGVVDGGGPQPLAASMDDRQAAKAWHARGATAAMVREVAMVVTQRQLARRKQAPTTLRYIDRPVIEQLERPAQSTPTSTASEIPDAEKRTNRLKALLRGDPWIDGWGPKPTEGEARAELNQRSAA